MPLQSERGAITTSLVRKSSLTSPLQACRPRVQTEEGCEVALIAGSLSRRLLIGTCIVLRGQNERWASGGSGQSSSEPPERARLGFLGAQLCLPAAAGPEQARRQRAESQRRAPHAPNLGSCDWLASHFQEGKANGMFFCSKTWTMVFFFLNEDHTLYSWTWLYRFIHASVSYLLSIYPIKGTGNKADGENLAMPYSYLQPVRFKVRKPPPSVQAPRQFHTGSSKQSCRRTLPNPFPTPRRCEGMRPGNVLASPVIFSSRGKLCNLLFGPTVWISLDSEHLKEKQRKEKATKHSFKRNPCFFKKVDVVWKWKHVISILPRDGKRGICEESLRTTSSSQETIIKTWMPFACRRDTHCLGLEEALTENMPCLRPKCASPSLGGHNH